MQATSVSQLRAAAVWSRVQSGCCQVNWIAVATHTAPAAPPILCLSLSVSLSLFLSCPLPWQTGCLPLNRCLGSAAPVPVPVPLPVPVPVPSGCLPANYQGKKFNSQFDSPSDAFKIDATHHAFSCSDCAICINCERHERAHTHTHTPIHMCVFEVSATRTDDAIFSVHCMRFLWQPPQLSQ